MFASVAMCTSQRRALWKSPSGCVDLKTVRIPGPECAFVSAVITAFRERSGRLFARSVRLLADRLGKIGCAAVVASPEPELVSLLCGARVRLYDGRGFWRRSAPEIARALCGSLRGTPSVWVYDPAPRGPSPEAILSISRSTRAVGLVTRSPAAAKAAQGLLRNFGVPVAITDSLTALRRADLIVCLSFSHSPDELDTAAEGSVVLDLSFSRSQGLPPGFITPARIVEVSPIKPHVPSGIDPADFAGALCEICGMRLEWVLAGIKGCLL